LAGSTPNKKMERIVTILADFFLSFIIVIL